MAQKDNIDSTKEHLNNLCRKYQSIELKVVEERVTQLSTKYDATLQLAAGGKVGQNE